MKNTRYSDHSSPHLAVQAWLEEIKSYPLEQNVLARACEWALQHGNILPALHMTDVLIEMQADSSSIVAAILYGSVREPAEPPTEEFVENHFGADVARVLKGIWRLEGINTFQVNRSEEQHNNVRKLILAISHDIRSVLVKLAERLTTLRALKQATREIQMEQANEVFHLYAPLANRLGLGQLKWRLEDWCFRYLEPEKYQVISKALNMRRTDREAFVKNMMGELRHLLEVSHIKTAKISGRAKHIYSLYKKLSRKNTLENIYDSIAMRVLVNSVEECYTVLGIVNAHWAHIPKEFDDYIAHPKPNGYQSIHTAIMGPDQRQVEIQIRTFDMHQAAELGVAAHWVYKEGKREAQDYENKINWLRQVIHWQQELSTTNLHSAFDDHVYVFTPMGEVMDLEKGATPLDFAYHIHSEVGHRCRGAKVNGKLVPLTHSLKTGEEVSIITSKTPHPSRDWLRKESGYLHTSRARAKVAQWFRHEDKDKEPVVKTSTKLEMDIPLPVKKIKSPQKKGSVALVEGVSDLLTQMAGCCKPEPLAPIVGYVTRMRGITIHRANCSNVKRSLAQNPNRGVKTTWTDRY